MARRCVCAKLLDQLRTDPRLRALPLAVRGAWIEIIAGLVAWAPSGSIRFQNSVTESVARWVGESVTETATHLETLSASGLIVLAEDGMGLSVPEMAEAHRRSEINRINGMKGGRPKPVKPPDPRQAEMKHVIPGGRAAPDETETGTRLAGAGMMMMDKKEDHHQGSPEWVSIGMELAGILGLPEQGKWTVRVVQQWLADGADRDLLVDVAREVKERARDPISSLNFMARAVSAALSARVVDHPLPWADAYEAARATWKNGGMQGPPPRLHDFKPQVAA